MKKFYLFTLLSIMTIVSYAQEKSESLSSVSKMSKVTATVDNNNLLVNWRSVSGEKDYWEVQGSADGKNFSTIGMVLGENPAAEKPGFNFKMPVGKMKPGLKYFRVLQVDSPETAIASNTIKITK
jgi:hypothetical protein